MKKLFFLFIVLITYNQLHAQLIADSSFNSNGLVYQEPLAGSSIYPGKFLELGDGSMLVASAREGKLHIWKYDASGALIPGFGNNGEAINTNLDNEDGNFSFIKDIRVLDNGKIVVCAQNEINNFSQFDSTKCYIALAVFTSLGAPDLTFNSIGYIISQPNTSFYFRPEAMDVNVHMDNVEIYVGGWAYEIGHGSCPPGFGKWFVAKYDITGNLDPLFFGTGFHVGSASEIYSGASTPIAYIRDIKVINNKVRATGNLHISSGRYFSFQINDNGIWDNSYGNQGKFDYPVTWSIYSNDLSQSEIMQDGSAIYHTTSRYFGTPDSAVTMVLQTSPNGNVNTNFGTSGSLMLSYLSQQYPRFSFKQDNSFLLCYYRPYGAQFSNQKIEFKKFNANGTLDNSFGINGWLSTQILNPDNYTNASWIHEAKWDKTQTKIYLLSSKQHYGSNHLGGFALMRYRWPGLAAIGLNEVVDATTFELYPNPTSQNKFMIKNVDINSEIKFYNLSGKEMKTNILFLNNKNVEISWNENLALGLYFVEIKSAGSKVVKSVFVK